MKNECCNHDCNQGRCCPNEKPSWLSNILEKALSMFERDPRVKVFKNGVEVGWYKSLVPGKNAVIAACKHHGFNIEEYEFRDYKTAKKVLWKGARADLGV